MAVSFMNIGTYARLFSSPVQGMASPTANLIYGGAVSSMYSKRLSEHMKSEMSSFVSHLNGNVYDLKSSSQPLVGNKKDNVWDTKTVSSTSNAISITAGAGVSNSTYKLSVSQLAQSQKNKGSEFSSNSFTSIRAGTNSFKISTGGKEAQISFDVDYNDTNKNALSSMANAINKAGLGITANVVTDDVKKTSYIEIKSNEAGEDSTFSISDVEGNAVAKSGAAAVSAQAADAKYRLNGQEYTSKTNTITLDEEKLKLTLSSVTQEEATVTVKYDKEAIMNAIGSFADNYNKTYNFAKSSERYVISNRLRDQLQTAVSSKAGYLKSIGVNVKYDGTMEIDEKKLSKALDEDIQKVKKLFASPEGIAANVKNITGRTLTSTSLDSTGGSLYKKDFNSFYSYMRDANKVLYQREQAGGLFINTLL